MLRVAHDVGYGTVEWLAILSLIFVLVAVLIEQTVRVLEACLLKAEVVRALGDTV